MCGCKTCASCGSFLLLTEFGRRSKEKDGLQRSCKGCTNAANRERRSASGEVARKRDRDRYQLVRSTINAQRRLRRQANAENLRPKWVEERRERLKRGYRFKRRKDTKAANQAERDARRIRATPAWADVERIKAIYRECRETSERTGIPHHVDHIVPLRGELVCGLHVESNLQVITASENVRKRNSFIAGLQPASVPVGA